MCRSIFAKYRYLGMQMSSYIISGVSRQKVAKFLHDVATSSLLLMRTFRQWYWNSSSSDNAKNASGISRRSWHFPKINWLPWQHPWQIENEVQIYYLHSNAFIWWKDRKNRSSISWHIRLNTPVFCHVVHNVHKWALFSLELLDQSSGNFYTM